MKIVFFGAGAYAENVLKQILSDKQLFQDEYLAFADNNPQLWGKSLRGIKIAEPSDLNLQAMDMVVITSIYDKAIRKQLIEEMGVLEKQIYTFYEYMGKCYADQAYRKKYGISGHFSKTVAFHEWRCVVYTAITGRYDELKDPLFVDEDLTYVCLTNNPEIKSKIWNIEYVQDEHKDNVHLARHLKMNPHLYFHDFDMSVWVDGKFQIMDDLRLYFAEYQKMSSVLCFPHPARECICDEVAACIMLKKGDKAGMLLQVSQYLKEGFPTNYGLYDTGCMARLHNDADVIAVMQEWENEIWKHSIRDQLSFPYVCWKNGFSPDICNLDINRNQWLEIYPHKSE